MKMMKMNKYKGIFSKIQLELVQSANIIDPKMVMFVCPMLHCVRLVGFSWTFHCRVTTRCCAASLRAGTARMSQAAAGCLSRWRSCFKCWLEHGRVMLGYWGRQRSALKQKREVKHLLSFLLSPYQKIPRWSPEDTPVIPAHEESGIIPNTSEIYTIFNSVRLLQAQHDLHVIYQILMNFCKVLPGHIKSWDEI